MTKFAFRYVSYFLNGRYICFAPKQKAKRKVSFDSKPNGKQSETKLDTVAKHSETKTNPKRDLAR